MNFSANLINLYHNRDENVNILRNFIQYKVFVSQNKARNSNRFHKSKKLLKVIHITPEGDDITAGNNKITL